MGKMKYTSKQIHAAIRKAAIDYWYDTIIDEDGSPEITQMFLNIGWGWRVADGYRNSEKWAWCGIGAANCMLRIGEYIEDDQCIPVVVDLDILNTVMPSTRRLASSKKWNIATEREPLIYHPSSYGGVRQGLIPGAIATIATRKYGNYRDDVGGHVVIVDKYEEGADTFTTIEFNAHGELGNGERGEGVIRTTRKVSDVRRVYLLHHQNLEHMGS